MKAFITRTINFLLLLFLVGQILSFILVPNTGDFLFDKKIKHLKSHSKNYNTLMFGSSRMYRHINPSVFDSLLVDYNFSTFNLATPGTYNPELYSRYETILLDKDLHFEYVFLELQILNDIAPKNLLAAKNYYWLDVSYLKFGLDYLFASDYTTQYKIITASKYVLSYIISLVDFSKFRIANDELSDEKLALGKNGDGFVPLDDQKNEAKRALEYLKDTTVVTERVKNIEESFNRKDHSAFVNPVHVKKLMELISLSEKRGTKLIFVIPPRLINYDELLAIKESLPEGKVVEIADAKQYPKLYRSTNSFDIAHLNRIGARLFSIYLAENIRRIESR